MKTWIKFCGTTSLDDALASIDAGADALGFIFASSKRQVSLEKAREIIRQLPAGVERIGVFLNATIQEIDRTVTEAGLTGIQLHGNEVAAEVHSHLARGHLSAPRIIKTLVVQDGFEMPVKSMAEDGVVDAWLLDSGAGSGKIFDWEAARARIAGLQGRFIIAGGLTPQNVGEAIHTFAPWGVDVVSGIEREPGHKDSEKMKAFITAVRKAEGP